MKKLFENWRKSLNEAEYEPGRAVADIDTGEDYIEPEMVEKILRREGYGKEGEIIYIVKVPEPVPPLSEIFDKDNEISLVEKFINFITGRNEK